MHNVLWPPRPRVVRPPPPAGAETAGGRRVPDLLQRVWDGWWESALMAGNGPPHDWIESDAPAGDAAEGAEGSQVDASSPAAQLSTMDEEPGWDVDDDGLIVARGTEMDAQRFGTFDALQTHDGEPRYYVIPVGQPVTQTLGALCVGHVPCQANRFYLSVAEAVPVPHEDRGAIRVRHMSRQEQVLHRWRPVKQERLDALVAARYATHPDESLVAAMRSVVDGLTDRHARFRNNPSPREVARRSRAAGRALQFCPPPIALPAPLLRSLVPPLDPGEPSRPPSPPSTASPSLLRPRRSPLSPRDTPAAATAAVGALRRLVQQVRAEAAFGAAVPSMVDGVEVEVDDYGYVLSPRDTPPVPQSTREAIMHSLSSAFEALDATPMGPERRIQEELLTDAFTLRRPRWRRHGELHLERNEPLYGVVFAQL